MRDHPSLHALALVCSLKASPEPSSSEKLAREVLAALEEQGASHEVVRVVDHDVKPGVEVDMGDGDEWPQIREKLLAADILVFATPTWVGHMTSVAQGVLERLDGELSETDDTGRPVITGKVAVVAVVGNEDGAHHISADAFQALSDVGFTIPAQGVTYWNGEAMSGVDYNDLDETPGAVASATQTLAENAAHLARLLKAEPYS
ncbi:flavodoxin family protein [Petropleomorpha daqingensis]|uniref:Multimeric flavodoxin WrbA n=1 Tax=Petropleomorpha daqingensis TaxID=2026353 RepID=A0A853CDU1_9ACTN|nr:flavodoxin family protein [Petropleomorpha daqingensis]NYJ06020.1 multimeric flavodoxin WrbA [Petropleomorpha daqingensis]